MQRSYLAQAIYPRVNIITSGRHLTLCSHNVPIRHESASLLPGFLASRERMARGALPRLFGSVQRRPMRSPPTHPPLISLSCGRERGRWGGPRSLSLPLLLSAFLSVSGFFFSSLSRSFPLFTAAYPEKQARRHAERETRTLLIETFSFIYYSV